MVWNRLQLLVAQGVVTMVGRDKIQATLLDGEVLDNLDRVEPYGLSYHPKKDSRAHLFFPSGDRAYGIVLVIGDKRYQMELAEGEVALHDDEGNHVLLKRGGIIEAVASSKVIAQTPLFETSADAKIGGNLLVMGTTHLSQDTTCDTNITAAVNVQAAMVLAGGFASLSGGAATMPSGMTATGTVQLNGGVTANGKSIDESHTHTSGNAGQPTSGVL
jgi:phage baseplate assembly protein V